MPTFPKCLTSSVTWSTHPSHDILPHVRYGPAKVSPADPPGASFPPAWPSLQSVPLRPAMVWKLPTHIRGELLTFGSLRHAFDGGNACVPSTPRP
jgi:hypothetical protein